MSEQNNTPPDQSAAQRQDAIDINDFVFAATGARVRRLTLPDGTHWFPAVDVAMALATPTQETRCAMGSHKNTQHPLAILHEPSTGSTVRARLQLTGSRNT
ncbi:hypothetical protein [Streptomyces sp. SA15]|uniref:hypothetical protein n=1 Tax=Streptomyces sp. SA15 TaxID=934019 RepID=UPI00211CB266|nr:hypothetical protein [Streptomyces sp. SA15]